MSTVGPWRPDSSKTTSGRRRPIFKRREGHDDGRSDTTLESPIVRDRLSGRVRIAEGVVILMVTLLLFGFWRLQVVHASHYLELAENNRRRSHVIRAPRGLITDRNGQLIAANRAAFNVAIVREEVDDRDANPVAAGGGKVDEDPLPGGDGGHDPGARPCFGEQLRRAGRSARGDGAKGGRHRRPRGSRQGSGGGEE